MAACCPGVSCPYGGFPTSSLKRPCIGFFHETCLYGGIPYHADGVPQVVYGGGPSNGPPCHGFPHVPASVGPHHGFPSALVVSLAHEDLRSSLALDVTMSLSFAGHAIPPHWATMTAP
jgi:hypothetical protein